MADITKTLKTPKISNGKTIAGKYKIIEQIGRGGMGVVFKAEDTRLKRRVALKFLPSELTQEKQAKKRFIQEAQAAAALNHPQICTIYEIDEAEGQTFIAMEYIEGMTLKDKLASDPLDIHEAADIAIQIADGLESAHKKGIIHRDIKPANVMINDEGQAKITDFGLAKLSGGVDLTQDSTLMGTVAYMSPEQARGEKVDHRTDIWSLGAMLYEMLSGKRPFKKSHEQALIYAILHDEPESITSFRPDIPSTLVHAINRALAKNLNSRYQSIQELRRDLDLPALVPTTDLEKSIAVLPFANMSADPEQEYFCDGMTEEIINALTHIGGLRVVARTSAFAFKGKDINIRKIGEELNVGKVLEGSVRKAGDRLRITAQLINVADGYHIWSERFDRNVGDVFDIQDEITLAIVNELKVKLLKKEKELLAKHGTEDMEAYNLYLKARYVFWNIMTPDFIDQSIKYYKEALKQQPDFALAYAGLAHSYNALGWFAVLPPKEIFPKAEEAANKAMEINDSISEAYRELAYINNFYHFNWQKAEKYCIRALEINPNSSYAHLFYTWILLTQSRLDEALDQIKQAQELDPVSSIIALNFGMVYYFRRETDKTIKKLKGLLELDPKFVIAQLFIGCAYEYDKLYDKAIKAYQAAFEIAGSSYSTSRLGNCYALAGESGKAREILSDLIKQRDQGYVSPYDIARIYMGLGEKDNSLLWLEKALEERTSWLGYLNIDPNFDVLQNDPGFKELKRKIGYPE